ncbi:hypothetical protein AKJ48_04210 [candidate division MSBL1 archaeon SCGC-AAA261O19]|uniref:Radical SAM core domain-containing protein n=1 Tax=candidate division MSBL1 archaeon SCGC-AAA261O19 TaxID=1698277 RepID=A0A133V9P9_9EURY|nr:hypothetical protein AKJ48_04210 [candidate division MSBL1 archaeon SCGC-AAA261O19]
MNRELRGSKIEDYDAPLFIAWQLTSECNLKCKHCLEESGPGHSRLWDEMEGKELFDFCDQIVENDIPYVAISGGEPMLHTKFFDICEYIRSAGLSLKVETNGHFIDEEEARKFAKLGLRSVQVSLDGATPETYEKMRPNGNFEKTVKACELLSSEGVNTEIVFVPAKFNLQEAEDVIDLAASLGASGFYTGKTMKIGRATENWDEINISDEEYDGFFKILDEKSKEYDGQMKVYYYPLDILEELKYRLDSPAASLLIKPNGDVKLIGPLPFTVGNVKRQDLQEVWENYKRAWRDPKVIEHTRKVIENPNLLAGPTDSVELY